MTNRPGISLNCRLRVGKLLKPIVPGLNLAWNTSYFPPGRSVSGSLYVTVLNDYVDTGDYEPEIQHAFFSALGVIHLEY